MEMAQAASTDADADPAGEPDGALAQRARHDASAFLTLYDRYAPRIGRYVAGRVGPGPETEDVISTVFLQALANIDSYDSGRGTVGAWLFGITRNIVNRQYRVPRPVVLFEDADHRVEEDPTPEERAVQQESVERLRTAIAHLTVEQQEALALRYLGELSFADAAQALGRSEGATKMLVRRGIDALRRIMRDDEEML